MPYGELHTLRFSRVCRVTTSQPRNLVTSKPGRVARAIAVLLVLFTLSQAHSQTIRDPDLDRVRGEITRLKSRLEEVHRKAKSAQQELEAVDLELDIRTHELTLAVDMQAKLDAERRSIEAQIAGIVPRIDQQKKALGRRLNALYRFGGLTYVRMFLSIDQRRDPVEALSMLSYLVSRDARLVSQFQEARRQLSIRNLDLADRQRKLADVRRVVEDRQRAVMAARNRKEQLLASLRTQETGSQQRIAELEEKAIRLEHLIAVLSRQRSGTVAGEDIRGFQGALPWPVAGKVVGRFGRQQDPKFLTFTTNNGVKIAALAGVPVRAVFQGTVLFSQWFKGYGNLIILDHGNRVFSLYGNLKSPNVAVGDRIASGQTIAGVGESEESPPGILYFEIRQDNRPEDPQKWLR
jgi:septal ring factor EnvC (AmiA/AmiB activator)